MSLYFNLKKAHISYFSSIPLIHILTILILCLFVKAILWIRMWNTSFKTHTWEDIAEMPRWEVPTCQPLYVFVGLVQPMAKAPALPITLIWGYFPTPKSSFPLTHSRCHGQPMRLCHHWSHSGFWEGPPLRQAAQTCVHFQVGHFHTGLSNWRKGSVAPPTGPHLGKSITIINKQHSLPPEPGGDGSRPSAPRCLNPLNLPPEGTTLARRKLRLSEATFPRTDPKAAHLDLLSNKPSSWLNLAQKEGRTSRGRQEGLRKRQVTFLPEGGGQETGQGQVTEIPVLPRLLLLPVSAF